MGPYAIRSRIGSGGFGDTYLAHDGHGARVAVKVLRSEHRLDNESRERFVRELRAGQALRSNLFSRVVDWELAGSEPWLCFTYAEGRALTELIHEAPLPIERVSRIATQLVDALADLTVAGLVHRDLKPANVRVGPNDAITVLDLGIASAPGWATTAVGGSGTLRYIAPEQSEQAVATPAMDVWAVGLIVSELAGGRHPFDAHFAGIRSLLSAIQNEPPDLSLVPVAWRPFIAACLQRDPEHRGTPDLLQTLLPGHEDAFAMEAIAAARDAASRIIEPSDRAQALAEVAALLFQSGDLSAARNVEHEARLAANSEDYLPLRDLQLSRIALTYAEAGSSSSARDAAGQISSPLFLCDAMVGLARAHANAGDRSAAWDAAQQARDAANQIEDAHARALALHSSAGAFTAGGHYSAARDATQQARDAANQIGEVRLRVEVLAEMAEDRAEAGDHAAALDAVRSARDATNTIDDPFFRGLAWCKVASAFSAARDQSAAIDAATKIDQPIWRVEVLAEMAERLAEAGDNSVARDAAQQARDTANQIEDAHARAHAQRHVARTYAGAGDHAAARDAAQQARDAANQIDDPRTRAYLLGGVARAYAGAGDHAAARDAAQQARDAANQIDDPRTRADVLADAAGAFAEAGDLAAARETGVAAFDTAVSSHPPESRSGLLHDISTTFLRDLDLSAARNAGRAIGDPHRRAEVLANLAQAYARAGELSAAQDAGQQAWRAATHINDALDREEMLARATEALTEAGDLSAARHAADGIDDPRRRAEALTALARARLDAEALG